MKRFYSTLGIDNAIKEQEQDNIKLNNMLNSTKTWQERFSEAFGVYWSNYKNTLYRCNPNDILDRPSIINSEDIKQFISDLRKRDMEALIEMLPNREDFANGESQAMACGRLLIKIEQLIKDYYEK